jgi:hypothetical protein
MMDGVLNLKRAVTLLVDGDLIVVLLIMVINYG